MVLFHYCAERNRTVNDRSRQTPKSGIRQYKTTHYNTMTSSQPPLSEPNPEKSAMMEDLTKDRPTMDAAVRSFMSLACAQSLTASVTDKDTGTTQKQVLQVARAVLQSINAHTFPIHKTVAVSLAEKPGTPPERRRELLELSSAAQLWNGLIQSNQKPSRLLGRRALKLAWMDMKTDVTAKLPEEVEEDVRAKNWNG